MGTVYYNGLHWCNPVGPSSQPQYTAGQQFSSAVMLAVGNISYSGCATGYNGWQEQCSWIRNNTGRTGEIILRLYWPSGSCIGSDPGQTLGTAFYNEIVQPAVVNFGIRNFQVLNELNVEYETYKSRQALAGDMYNIAYWIKHLAQQNNLGLVYLGFPGPGTLATQDPASSDWNAYWDTYAPYITQTTDQGNAYNWLAVHAYEYSASGLAGRMEGQYNSLVGKFPGYPHRYTEYGIPLDGAGYCSPLPCGDPNAYQARANDCSSAIATFRNYVQSQAGPDVYSVCYYIAYDSDAGSQDGADTRYELVLDNNNLGPAQTLAGTF